MNVPYPHLVDILRAGDTGVQDGYGRPLLSDFVPVARDVPAWVQEIGTEEQQLLSQAGAVKVTHQIFMDPCDISEADMIAWVNLRGQAYRLEVVDVGDPDGTGDHFEITTILRTPAPIFPVVS